MAGMDNVGRAEKIYRLLGLEGEDTPDQYYRVADVLCDLRHWCDRNGVDFAQEESMAVTYYEDELDEEIITCRTRD